MFTKTLFESASEKTLLPSEAGGMRRIAVIGRKNKEMRRTFTINTERGSTPEKLVFEHCSDGVWSEPQITVKTEWEEMESVWIPKQCEIEDKYGKRSIRMDFIWTSANAKVADYKFDVHSFSLPKDTFICDTRLGFDYLIERIGDDSFKPRPANSSPPSPE